MNWFAGTDASGLQNIVRLRPPDTVDICQSDFDSLIRRKIHSGNTCHSNLQLSLPLLVLRVHTDDPHDTLPMHNLALVANFLN